MSTLPELTADGYDFAHMGKSYHVDCIDNNMMAEFEKRLFAKAKERLLAVKDVLSSQAYELRSTALADRYMAGEFSMMQQGESNPLKDASNTVTLFSLMLDVDEKEVLALLSDKAVRAELTGLFRCAMRDSFPGLSFPNDQ